VYDACELSKYAVSGRVDHAPAMFRDHWEDGPLVAFEIANCAIVISTHEGAVASDIRGKDRSQPPRNLWICRTIRHHRTNQFDYVESG
jgi:hypothetical protein